jgi:acetyl esterase
MFLRWYHPAGFDTDDSASLPAALAPANAKDLSGLPPAYIATAEFDPLRDDGARYAELLGAAGVSVQLDNAPTLVHGYLLFSETVPAAAEAVDRGLAALKSALRPPAAIKA